MFSGIVEEAGIVQQLVQEKENLHITISCSFAKELQIDQSIAHNGVCLTVVEKNDQAYTVTAIKETLEKSNLGMLSIGDKVNLERSLAYGDRMDGHFVQGHVDQTATCTRIEEADGSWYFTFAYKPLQDDYITVEKGSVTINGVSLTVVNSQLHSFQVAIIPYTYQVTNFHEFTEGSIVNLEFDVIGKYITRIVNTQLENHIKNKLG